jgi:hypothetical protein
MVWSKVEELRGKSKPQQFTATFIKKDNTIRVMTAMVGVKAGVSGKGMSWNPEDRGMLCVHECQNESQKGLPAEDKKRIINVMTLLSIKIEGEEYQVVDNLTSEQIEKVNQSILERRTFEKMQKDLKRNNVVQLKIAA